MGCFLKNQRGQSLIELSVAVGLASMALLAIISLVLVGIVTQRRSANYYTAINLAREAIEAARNIRDTNWLRIEYENQPGDPLLTTKWNDYLHNGNLYSAILQFKPEDSFAETQSMFAFSFTNSATEEQKIIYKKELANPTPHPVYLDYYTCTAYTDCEKTLFQRTVDLKPICDGSGPNANLFTACPLDPATNNFICENDYQCDDATTAYAPQIGIRISVEMNWREGGAPANLKLVDDLYNWR